ncbi:gamma-secretase aspartyl protease complex, presenilin enhancer-2 subunit [Neocallimastix lanati (nom. inval.)]|jgi:presenilin enhancer 2|nr:gamma-secretase aspartyl protease complex, presenilin enhancer-2 subunit [Neocallimastix sp. JGI-2020a]
MTKAKNMSEQEILSISKKMFYGGFAFLPWLWLVNWIYFNPVLKQRPGLSEQIHFYVKWSFIGAAIWIVLLATWVIIFQTTRTKFGSSLDRFYVSVPKG